MPSEAEAFVGQTLDGRFTLLSHKNDGNFGHVFEASDADRDQNVAIKMLSPFRAAMDEHCVAEFDTEARLLELLAAARNVVNFDGTFTSTVDVEFPPGSGRSQQLPVRYHVLELADASLDELLAVRGEVPWEIKLALFRDIVCGLHQMHLAHIVHRDLKASNALLFSTNTRRPVAKLTDLGRSRLLDDQANAMARAYLAGRGDPAFAAPELIWLQGAHDSDVGFRRGDLYLLGSMFFEIATGQGITGFVVPNALAIKQHLSPLTPERRQSEFRGALPGLRAAYQMPLDILGQELPKELRVEGVALVNQLCEPDPGKREQRFRAERNLPPWGLNWVLRRVDIMSHRLRLEGLTRPRRSKAG